ncbi:MAG TPA: NAD(P)/FAD-dependent oxidoreductase [Thermoanaerobacterales bacterium]|nr:NAD(P)/FAD-dependent oxidoreductase [Thermoanaerobacterales bacterium]
MDPIVIVGNGVAAVSAVEAFREHDKNTRIIIVSAEPYHAYYRMRLSHLLGEDPEVEKLLIHDPVWYEENGIQVLLGRRAVSIDVVSKSLKLDDGKVLTFSKLLLAQGSDPFVPPVSGTDLDGVFPVRTVDDVKKLYTYSLDKNSGVVVGGGVLGLEAAWALTKKGKKISVFEVAPYLLIKQLDEESSGMLKSLGEKAGMSFILSDQLVEIKGNGSVSGVSSKSGREVEADFVVFSIGVRPNTGILKDIGINVNRGVVVDEHMHTSLKDIYAAGDVAEFAGKVYGIWPVAKEQGKIAGLNMAGISASYSEIVPSNYIKVFDTEIFSAGDLCKEESAHAVITDIQPENNIYRKVFFKKNNVPVGVILLGDTKPAVKISRAIKIGRDIPEDIIRSNNFERFVQQLDYN